ncbi:aspartate carbamoyltransferase [Candidatus Peregrinibacteria bacterium CG10_big_fil_rev_8_21_14_0_10_49_16]|nr:MAG: aspartate carbamoyltransferase [Candidatus Peregrinibacteria bacterium CG22_combo_CG10-13_8_21_14_all_49_11]PIR52459.1 MAG: aspartate carbamoyltransferase [Candidatus Peregrinibacteria bacterium CG10_big_fil_rev_8_21_14_0_10_49_16]
MASVSALRQLSFGHLVSTEQVSREDMLAIFSVAQEMELVLQSGGMDLLQGKILASLFFEPSTRTRLSFETAMQRLGGEIITADGIQFSSLYKGESIEDMIRVVSGYADVICMRHPEEGSAEKAAAASVVPFLNAGDGPGQHPTQGLLDVYTIQKECGRLDHIHIAVVGDLLYGRTVHSVSVLLSHFSGVRFTLISPPELRMPRKIVGMFDERGIAYTETEQLEVGLSADVIYMTRIQQERFEDKSEYERLKGSYVLHADHLQGKKSVVMHPLPRVDEIDPSVDTLPHAAYFRQSANGVPVRMALLAMMLS